MTTAELATVFKDVRKACRLWLARARAGTLPAVEFQRAGIRGIGSTYVGTLWTISRLPEELQRYGLVSRRRWVHEPIGLVRWFVFSGQASEAGETWEADLARVRPSEAVEAFRTFRESATPVEFQRFWTDPNDADYQAVAELWETRTRKAEPITESGRSTLFPTSGVWYGIEIVATGGQWFPASPGFESLRLDLLTDVFPTVIRYEWGQDEPPAPALPNCVSTRARLRVGCCFC